MEFKGFPVVAIVDYDNTFKVFTNNKAEDFDQGNMNHAEHLAIKWMKENDVKINKIYTSLIPCFDCHQELMKIGTDVFYLIDYLKKGDKKYIKDSSLNITKINIFPDKYNLCSDEIILKMWKKLCTPGHRNTLVQVTKAWDDITLIFPKSIRSSAIKIYDEKKRK